MAKSGPSRRRPPWRSHPQLFGLIVLVLVGLVVVLVVAFEDTAKNTSPSQTLRARVAGVYEQVSTGERLTLRPSGAFDFSDLTGEARLPAWQALTEWSGKPARHAGDVLIRVPVAVDNGKITSWYSFLLRGGRLYSVSGANDWLPTTQDMYVLRKRL